MSDRNRPENLDKLRAALSRHGVKVNSRTPAATLHAHVEKITGKPLPALLCDQRKALNQFVERGVAYGMPVRPFKPLSEEYAEGQRRHRELCELVR